MPPCAKSKAGRWYPTPCCLASTLRRRASCANFPDRTVEGARPDDRYPQQRRQRYATRG